MNIKQLKIALGALKRCFYDTRLDNLGFCGKNVNLEYPISFHNPRNVFLEDNTESGVRKKANVPLSVGKTAGNFSKCF